MEAPLFILYFVKFLSILLFLYGVGKIILPQKEGAPFYNAFFNTFLSAILFAVLFAIWKTHMISVMLGFVIWFILWYAQREEKTYYFVKNWRSKIRFSPRILSQIALFTCCLIGIFAWAFLARIQVGTFPFIIPEGTALAPNDIHIYALRSFYLGETGQENYFGVYNTFDANFHGPKPYHYLELWLNAGIGKFMGGLHVLNFSLICGPLFHAFSLLGILAIWERFVRIEWYHILLSFAFLWVAGLYFFYDQIGFPAFSLPVMTYRFKMVVYYPFFLGFVLCSTYLEWKKSILLLLGLSIATVVAAPTVLGGLLLFLAGYWIFAKKVIFPLKSLFVYIILIFGFLGFFYLLAGSSSAGTTFELGQTEATDTFQISEIISKLPHYLKHFLYALIHVLLLYAPYLLLFYLFRQSILIQIEKIKPAFILTFCLLIAGAAAWSLLFDFAQSSQLFYNTAIPILNIVGILLFILIGKDIKLYQLNKKEGIAIVLFLLIISSQFYLVGKTQFKDRGQENYSSNYLQQIDSLVHSGNLSSVGAALKGPNDYKSEYSKMAAGYTLGYYLLYMDNGYATVSLSDFDIPINPSDRRNNLKDIQSGAFYQYVERQKKANIFQSIWASQVDFLREYGINFLIISSNGQVPVGFENYIQQEIKDSISGERFIFLEKLNTL